MAVRPVFIFDNGQYFEHHLDFTWHGGFALAQVQKCIEELHTEFKTKYPGMKVLEVSTKSPDELGIALSAFNLEDNEGFTVESLFQGSKVFEKGGPYTDLYAGKSVKAKKDNRIKDSGDIVGFSCKGVEYPNDPKTLFYNWIYINALVQNKDLAKEVLAYDAFTDIAFNPDKSVNCQAQALSIYVALVDHSLLDQALGSVESFSRIVYNK